MLNPFVYDFFSKNKQYENLEPKIPVLLPETYSQAGEDIIIQSLLYRLNYISTGSHKDSFSLENVRYLEIGANHPVSTSSTYLLSSKQSRGILAEANPIFTEILKQERVNDEIFNVAIVDDDSKFVKLHLSEANELSSLYLESPLRWSDRFAITESIIVPAMNINELAEIFWNHFPGNFQRYLSIDCEGMDYSLLKVLNLEKYPFDIIQVEPGEPLTPKNLSTMESNLNNRGYALIALTEVNAFFVNKLKFKIS